MLVPSSGFGIQHNGQLHQAKEQFSAIWRRLCQRRIGQQASYQYHFNQAWRCWL